ncbi:uncharacterized protein evi2b [Odontesthes bonariensis]|uniref:uncharacterized protein evi2b n=1 Tax=Odontesthes bonariensis TaxID=219752 RepID=UPI003F582442
MTTDFISLIFLCSLTLTASSTVTSGLRNNLANVTASQATQQNFNRSQLTTQETSILQRPSETPDIDITPSTIDDVNPLKEKNSRSSSLQTTHRVTPTTFTMNTQTAATPITSIRHDSNSSTGTTEEQSKRMTPATVVATIQASNPTKPSTVLPVQSTSTQTKDTGKTSSAKFNRKEIFSSTSPHSQSTVPISTATTSFKLVDSKSTSAHRVTSGNAARSTGPHITTAVSPVFHITKAKKKQDSNKGTNDGKVVAGLIGGALTLMMIGFLVIYIKKRRVQKQQITTTDWAGPTPFLVGEDDNGQVPLRSSNRISLSSFLPQRLSKRLSLLPEMDEELQDMTQGATFGGKQQGKTFRKDGQVNNGSSIVIPEMKSVDGAADTAENRVSETPLETKNILATNNSEAANQTQDNSVNLFNESGAQEKEQGEN